MREVRQKKKMKVCSNLFIYVVAAANMEVDCLADELHRQKEESRQQHEELAILTSKLLHAESQIQKVSNVISQSGYCISEFS